MRAARTSSGKPARRLHIVLSRTVHRTVFSVIEHDCLNTAQSAAYASILALFPGLIVAAAVIGLLPDNAPLRFQLSAFFDRVLPADVSPILNAYFQSRPSNVHSARALITAALVGTAGASNVILTIMEGLRRAQRLPERCWGFWAGRIRSILLAFLALVPLSLASLLVVFGHAVTLWIGPGIGMVERTIFYAAAFLIRWAVTLGATASLIALLYKLGLPSAKFLPNSLSVSALTPDHKAWLKALPGALVATTMWFLSTLLFGWYVTRFANYSEVYGSLGAAIALLFWLYITALSVLCGAEFNANLHSLLELEIASHKAHPSPHPAPLPPADFPAPVERTHP